VTSEPLHIASFLVLVTPDHRRRVSDWLSRQPGAEVSAEDPAGKLVVVVESDREARILELIEAVRERAGVLDASLVYHQWLDPATADEPQEASS
jgi:periplasmic nitrate reductase NapD